MLVGRGLTFSVSCEHFDCFSGNPAFLGDGLKTEQYAYSFYSASIHVQENLYEALENWKGTQNKIENEKYRELLYEAWQLSRNQSSNFNLQMGLRLRNYYLLIQGLQGAFQFQASDPVLPVVDVSTYSVSSISIGASNELVKDFSVFRNAMLGFQLRFAHSNFRAFKASLDDGETSSDFEQNKEWASLRLGFSSYIKDLKLFQVTAVLQGVPIYHLPSNRFRSGDNFDFQLGAHQTFFHSGQFQLAWVAQSAKVFESVSLNQKFRMGMELNYRAISLSTGVAESSMTYGLKIKYPIGSFSFGSYRYRAGPYYDSPLWPRIYSIQIEAEI